MMKRVLIAVFLVLLLCSVSVSLAEESPQTALTYKVRLSFDGGEAVWVLPDQPASRSLVAQLPITVIFEDFNGIEKIARMPEALDTAGMTQGIDPAVADVTLYVPWNTFVFYYDDFGYDGDLVAMGQIERGMELLKAQTEDFEVTLELMPATVITLTVGDTVLTAELEDSQTTRDFLATLPRTMSMNRYDDREYYGKVGTALSEVGTAISDYANGDVTYYVPGGSFAIFFGKADSSSQSGLIRMGRMTSDLTLFDSLPDEAEVRIELAETKP